MMRNGSAAEDPNAGPIDNVISSRQHFGMLSDASLEDCLANLVDEVYRLNGRLLAAAKMTTRVAGLRPPHWIVLTAIARAPEPPTVARIGRALGQTRQGVQRVADDLVERGLVQWIGNPDHLRAKRLVLIEAGKAAFELANREGDIWLRRIGAGMDVDQLREAASTLREVRRRLESDAKSVPKD